MVDRYMGAGLLEDVQEFFPEAALKQVPPQVQALLPKIIDTRFSAYKEVPERQADERYLDLLLDLDMHAPHFERMTGLLGTCALLSRWDEDEGGLCHVPLIEFEPLFLASEREPYGVIYPLHEAGAKADQQRWAVWTPLYHFETNSKGFLAAVEGNEEMVNPYGVIPVVFAHRGAQGRDWWREPLRDVLQAQTVYNVLGTLVNIGVLLQGLGQPWTNARMDQKDIVLNAFRLLQLPDGGTFSFASPGSDLRQLLDVMKQQVESVCFAHSLKLKWGDAASSGTSGEHLRIMEVELTEAVLSDQAGWRNVERQRFAVDRAIIKVRKGWDIPDDYGVNFTEPHIPLTWREEFDRWQLEYDTGLSSKVRYLMAQDADLTEEDAWAQLDEINAERAREPKTGGRGDLFSLLSAPVPGGIDAA
jgi:hypothetical protein